MEEIREEEGRGGEIEEAADFLDSSITQVGRRRAEVGRGGQRFLMLTCFLLCSIITSATSLAEIVLNMM